MKLNGPPCDESQIKGLERFISFISNRFFRTVFSSGRKSCAYSGKMNKAGNSIVQLWSGSILMNKKRMVSSWKVLFWPYRKWATWMRKANSLNEILLHSVVSLLQFEKRSDLFDFLRFNSISFSIDHLIVSTAEGVKGAFWFSKRRAVNGWAVLESEYWFFVDTKNKKDSGFSSFSNGLLSFL